MSTKSARLLEAIWTLAGVVSQGGLQCLNDIVVILLRNAEVGRCHPRLFSQARHAPSGIRDMRPQKASRRAAVERDGVNWAELALPAGVVAAVAHDGINGDMLREVQVLLRSAAFTRALKVRSQASRSYHAGSMRVELVTTVSVERSLHAMMCNTLLTDSVILLRVASNPHTSALALALNGCRAQCRSLAVHPDPGSEADPYPKADHNTDPQ